MHLDDLSLITDNKSAAIASDAVTGQERKMIKDGQVRVFDDAGLIRDSVTMLCKDRLAQLRSENEREQNSAVDQLCWEMFPLQGRTFDFETLRAKCDAIIQRSKYEPLKLLRADDIAHEISSPVGGW